MPKILVLSLSSIDNDSRILKEINTYRKKTFHVTCVSVNSFIKHNFNSISIYHKAKRLLRIPGLSIVLLLLRFMFRVIKLENYTHIHCNDLNTLPIGVVTKIFHSKVKIIYDTHEYAVNDIPNQSKVSITIKFIIESFLIKFADEVITVSDSIAKEYSRLYKLPEPHVVLNCPLFTEQKRNNLFRETLPIRDEQTIFLYQGGLSKGRGIELLLEAFSNLDSDKKVLACMGYGPLQALVQEKADNFSTIFFHPFSD